MYHHSILKFLYLCVVWFYLVSIYFYYSTLNKTIISNEVKSYIAIKPPVKLKKKATPLASSEIIFNFALNKLVE